MFHQVLIIYLSAAELDPTGSLISMLANASGPLVLAVIVVGAIVEWWVPGRTHKRIVAERDALLRIALKSQEVGSRALTAAEIIKDASRS